MSSHVLLIIAVNENVGIRIEYSSICPQFSSMSVAFLLRFIRYAPRWDCGSKYKIQVELLNQTKEPVETFAPETIYFEQWNDQQWNQVGVAKAPWKK